MITAIALTYLIPSQVGNGILRWPWLAGFSLFLLSAVLVLSLAHRWKLLPTLPPMPPSDFAFCTAVTIVGVAVGIVGVFARLAWLMALGFFLVPLAFILCRSWQGMKAGQFSLRWLFFLMTLLAVYVGGIVAIERWHANTVREIEQNRIHANREAQLDLLEKKKARLETRRDKLSPEIYEQRRKAIEQEAAKLGDS